MYSLCFYCAATSAAQADKAEEEETDSLPTALSTLNIRFVVSGHQPLEVVDVSHSLLLPSYVV